MPVLSAEPTCYPASLFDGAPGGGEWVVLHTRPRQEKALARDLYQQKIPYFLPLHASRKRYGARYLVSHLPLFAGYVFLYGDRDQWLAALGTQRVVNTLKVPDQQRLAGELAQIRRVLESGAMVTPEDRLVPGARVFICNGPLAGMKGTILDTPTGRRFIIEVDFIQKGASVEVDEATELEVLTD